MSETAAPLWSAEQHGWLAALGYSVYMQGALPEAVAETAPRIGMAVERAPAPASSQRPRPAPAPMPAVTPTPEVLPPVRRPAPRLPDSLHIALIRAAGINPNAPGMAEIIAQWPASSELRGNPAAKRALWPRLRALRKQDKRG